MNNDLMIKELRRCGLLTFVTYYSKLSNFSIPDKSLFYLLIKEEGYTLNSARTKVRSARNIIKSSKGKEALTYISKKKSSYITNKLINTAKSLIS